jgi:sialic acid synthase SpsE
MPSFGKLKLYKDKPTIIAEAGVNHECKIKNAYRLISDARDCGVDVVKFQTYKADELAIKNSKAYWDLNKEKTTTQRSLFEKYDKFDDNDFYKLYQYCKKKKIIFLSTLFSVDLVYKLSKYLPLLKVASADITNVPLLKAISLQKKPILLSTGASTLDETKFALRYLNLPKKQICIMHCVLNYPTKDENANLNYISTLKKKFTGHIIGYSDHVTPDNQLTSIETAWNLGAQIIEKHFTFDKKMKGNDHYHSADKNDFINFYKRMEKIKNLKGSFVKNIKTEINSVKFARRSIVAKKNIKKGEQFTESNITTKRPGIYIPANKWDIILKKKSNKNIKSDTPIKAKDFS